jgi:uncharacterized membrane protein
MPYLFPILLGISLGASTGLHTTLPLLLVAAAAHFNIGNFALRGDFAWLTSDTALIILLVAAILETIADKVPAVDHVLHAIGTVARPIAATLSAAAVFTHGDRTTAAVVGLIIAAPAALGVHAAKAGLRIGSSALTFGCANPFISLIEDAIAAVLSIVAIFAPLVALMLLIVLAFVCVRILRRVRVLNAGSAAHS